MSEEDRLRGLRERIDAIDDRLLELFNERAQCALGVAAVKRETAPDADVYRPDREASILRRIAATNAGPLADEVATGLIREVISACLALQKPLKVVYLGPEGTFTHAAARRAFGAGATLIPAAGIDETLRRAHAGDGDLCVVPIENSLEGSVAQTLDCLRDSPLQICGEVVLPIHHQLLTASGSLSGIDKVYAHAQALAQCRGWLNANLGGAERIAAISNAEAARLVRDRPGAAAIASREAAALYGLEIASANIEDHPENSTRFVVLGRQSPQPTGADRTSLMFTMPNRPGALYEILQTLAEAGISMTRIESRPLGEGSWDYVFFVDIEGHRADPRVAAMLERIESRTSMLKILGSYPRSPR